MVKNEIIMAVSTRRYVNVCTLRVDVHYVVYDVCAFAIFICRLLSRRRLWLLGRSR